MLLHIKLTTFKVRDSAYRVAVTSDPISYLGMMLLQTLILLSVSVQLSSAGELSLGPQGDTYGE